MSYQSGKMGMAECLAMVFIMTFARVFLTTPSRTLMNHAGAAWISSLLIGLAGIVMLFVINRVLRSQEGDLLEAAEFCLGKPGKWLIGLYYISLFWTEAVLLTRQFAENTLLTALPLVEFLVVLLAYGLTIVVILYIGLEPICRAAYVIIPFGIIGLLTVLLGLIPLYEFNGLFPWQGRGIGALVGKSMLAGGINMACIAPALLAGTFHDRKTWFAGSLMGAGISIGTKTLAILVFTLVFGTAVGQERTLPFYELARLVYLGRFIQRVESLFILLWVIVGVMAIALHIYVGIYLFTRLFDLPTMRPLIPITVILITTLCALPADVAAVLDLERRLTHTFFNGGLYAIPILLLVLSVWKGKRKARRKSC